MKLTLSRIPVISLSRTGIRRPADLAVAAASLSRGVHVPPNKEH